MNFKKILIAHLDFRNGASISSRRKKVLKFQFLIELQIAKKKRKCD